MSNLRMHTGPATFPVNDADMLPAALNHALNAEAAHDHWIASNAKGTAAQATYVAAVGEWASTHSQAEYVDQPAYSHALDLATREQSAAVSAATRASTAALIAYNAAQRAGFKDAKGSFAAAYLDADRRAREALAALDKSLVEREALMRYVIIPEHSSQIGRGHFLYASALGLNKSATAQHQRADIALVVNIAPRDLVTVKAKA